jgi:lysozyme family protein
MANVDKLIPIIIKWEAGVTGEGLTNEQLFEKAKIKGFANDPVDAGGATMIGITIGTYTTYRKVHHRPIPSVKDLKAITYEEWRDILKTMYWDKMKADQITNQSIANLCVNTVWGSGTGYIKKIQGVLCVAQDGIVGPITLGRINGWQPQKDLFDRLWRRRKKFFDDIIAQSVKNYERKIGRKATDRELLKCTYKRFEKGWMNRLNDFEYAEEN